MLMKKDLSMFGVEVAFRKALTVVVSFTRRLKERISQVSAGRPVIIWLWVILAGSVFLSSCATLNPVISYSGRGSIAQTESGVTSGSFTAEVEIRSEDRLTKPSTPASRGSGWFWTR